MANNSEWVLDKLEEWLKHEVNYSSGNFLVKEALKQVLEKIDELKYE